MRSERKDRKRRTYFALTRTFFPSRSLQMTSIILCSPTGARPRNHEALDEAMEEETWETCGSRVGGEGVLTRAGLGTLSFVLQLDPPTVV